MQTLIKQLQEIETALTSLRPAERTGFSAGAARRVHLAREALVNHCSQLKLMAEDAKKAAEQGPASARQLQDHADQLAAAAAAASAPAA